MKPFPEELINANRTGWKADLSCLNELRLFRMKSTLFSGASEFHKIEVVELEERGRSLFLDDCARIFSVDEYVYHEALIHPLMQVSRALQRPISVLIVGDGDGGAVRELLRFKHVARITWVEIDRVLVDTCFEHLNLLPRAALQDPRLTLIFSDGYDYIESAKEIFDAVVISVTENMPGGLAQRLYSKKVYPLVKNILAADGVIGRSLCSVSPVDARSFSAYCTDVEDAFASHASYSVGLPGFGIDWGFVLASSSDQVLSNPWECREVQPRFFTEDFFHKSIVRPTVSVPHAHNHPQC